MNMCCKKINIDDIIYSLEAADKSLIDLHIKQKERWTFFRYDIIERLNIIKANLKNHGKEIEKQLAEITICGDWEKMKKKEIEDAITEMEKRYQKLRKIKIRVEIAQLNEMANKIGNKNIEVKIVEEMKELEIEKKMKEIKKYQKIIKEIHFT